MGSGLVHLQAHKMNLTLGIMIMTCFPGDINKGRGHKWALGTRGAYGLGKLSPAHEKIHQKSIDGEWMTIGNTLQI